MFTFVVALAIRRIALHCHDPLETALRLNLNAAPATGFMSRMWTGCTLSVKLLYRSSKAAVTRTVDSPMLLSHSFGPHTHCLTTSGVRAPPTATTAETR